MLPVSDIEGFDGTGMPDALLVRTNPPCRACPW